MMEHKKIIPLIFENDCDDNHFYAEVTTIIDQDDNPWWVAKEVCEILDLHTARAVSRLDDYEKAKVRLTHTGGGNRDMRTIVNESGLYELIFGSRKPEAKAFKKWIKTEVIPAIRKTGGYIAGEKDMTNEELLSSALLIAQRKIEEKQRVIEENHKVLKWKQKLIKIKQKLLDEAKPKVDSFDSFMDSEALYNFNTVAKMLKVGPIMLTRSLRRVRVLMENNKPYSPFMNAGYFEVKTVGCKHNSWAGPQTFITPKGLDWLDKLISNKNLTIR